ARGDARVAGLLLELRRGGGRRLLVLLAYAQEAPRPGAARVGQDLRLVGERDAAQVSLERGSERDRIGAGVIESGGRKLHDDVFDHGVHAACWAGARMAGNSSAGRVSPSSRPRAA